MKRSETRRSIWSSFRSSSGSNGSSSNSSNNNDTKSAPIPSTPIITHAQSTSKTEDSFNILPKSLSRHSTLNKMSSSERLRNNRLSINNNNSNNNTNTKSINTHNNNNNNNNTRSPISTNSSDSTLNEISESISNLQTNSKMSKADKRRSMLNFHPLINQNNLNLNSKAANKENNNDLIEIEPSSDLEADTTLDSSNILDINLDFDQDDDNSKLLDSAFNDYQLALKAFELEDIAAANAGNGNNADSVRQSTLYQLKKSPKEFELPTISKDNLPSNELDLLTKDSNLKDEYTDHESNLGKFKNKSNNQSPSRRISEVEIKECAGFILVGTSTSTNDLLNSPTKPYNDIMNRKYSKKIINDDLEELFDYSSLQNASQYTILETSNNNNNNNNNNNSNEKLNEDVMKRQIQRTSLYFN